MKGVKTIRKICSKTAHFWKMGVGVVALLLNLNNVHAQANCQYWDRSAEYLKLRNYPSGYCANPNTPFSLTFFGDGFRIHNTIPADQITFEINWGDGNITPVKGNDSRIQRNQDGNYWKYKFLNAVPHPLGGYPPTDNCVYSLFIDVLITNGGETTRCPDLDFLQVTIWEKDNTMGGELILVDPSGNNIHYVCEGQEINVHFIDQTLLNCNWLPEDAAAQEKYVKNDLIRHTRFTYGVVNNAAAPAEGWPAGVVNTPPQIPMLYVGGSSGTQITNGVGAFLPPSPPRPLVDPLIRTDNPGISLNIPTQQMFVPAGVTTAGQVFTIRLDNWNFCNSYLDDNMPVPNGQLANPPPYVHDPVTTWAYIIVTKAPPPIFPQSNVYCHQDHYTTAQRNTLYQVSVSHDESGGKPLSTFQPGVYRWYDEDGKLLVTKAYTDITFNPVTYGTTGKRLKTGTPGIYKYYVTYQWTGSGSETTNCETPPVEFTWIVRESIKTAPGQPKRTPTTTCAGQTITLYYGDNPNSAPTNYTVGGDIRYEWRILQGDGVLTYNHADGRSVNLELPSNIPAPDISTIKLGVRREWQTATSWLNPATGVNPTSSDLCPSIEEEVIITVNPLPTAQLNAGADICADESFQLSLTNIAGANTNSSTGSKNFDITMNYHGMTGSALNFETINVNATTDTRYLNPPAQTAGTIVQYYIYQVKDRTTGCISIAATDAPFTTAQLTVQDDLPVLVTKREALSASPTVTFPTNSTLLCANTDFTATANQSAQDVNIAGVNVSKPPAVNIIPDPVTLSTTYEWAWFPSATSNDGEIKINHSQGDFNSGDAASPAGTQKRLEVRRQYVTPASSGSNCSSPATTVRPTVIPKPTATITSGDLEICENTPATVNIRVTGYTSGSWTVGWRLSKGGFSITGTTPAITNPTGAGAGAANSSITLNVTDFGGTPVHGEYVFTLTSVVQTTGAMPGDCADIPDSSIKIMVIQAPSVTLTGGRGACEGHPYFIIYATDIHFPTGVSGVPYEIEYSSSYTGSFTQPVSYTLEAGDNLVIPWAHIEPPHGATTSTLIHLVSVKQGNCVGVVGTPNQHTIDVVPYPEPAEIITENGSTCDNFHDIEAKPVSNPDYEGSWEIFSQPDDANPGKFDILSTPAATTTNPATRFGIGALGQYILVWKIKYIGSVSIGDDCESPDTLKLMFGTDAQLPIINLPTHVCGDRIALEARTLSGILYPWEEAAKDPSTGWTSTPIVGVTIVPDPTDKFKAIGILDSGLDGAVTFKFTIGTSEGCAPSDKDATVKFVGRPELDILPVLGELCPYDQENDDPVLANQIDYTLNDTKSFADTQFEWYVSPDPVVVADPAWTTTASVTDKRVAFNTPANNNTYDMNYNIIQKAYRHNQGIVCETQAPNPFIVKPKPRLPNIPNQNMCPDESITIRLDPANSATHTVTYYWTNNGPDVTQDFETITITSDIAPYNYTLTAGKTTKLESGYLVAEINNITLQAEVRECKSSPVTFRLTVNPQPVITISGEPAIYCPGQTLSPTSTPQQRPSFTSNVAGAAYQWEYGRNGDYVGLPTGVQNGNHLGTFTTPSDNSTKINRNLTGEVTLTVTGPVISNMSGKGCVATDHFTVTLKPQPVMHAMLPESVCASADEASVVKFPTDIRFQIDNMPAGTVDSDVRYEWYNSGDVNIAGTKFDEPLVTLNGIATSTVVGGTAGTGIFNIPIPLSRPDGVDRTAIITVHPFMAGCAGEPLEVRRTAFALPILNNVPDETVCPGDFFSSVTFEPNLNVTLIEWTNNNTQIGLGSDGTGFSINFNPALPNPNTTGDVIDATIKAWATVYHSATQQCKGPEITFHKKVNPSPVIDALPAIPPVCPGESFSELTFTSSGTAEALRDDIEYTWTVSDNSIGVSMPKTDVANVMPSYQGSNNTSGVTIDYVYVEVSATLYGCPSANTPRTFLILKPKPVMNFIDNKSYCPDQTIPVIEMKSNVVGKENTGTQWRLNNINISQYYPEDPPSPAIDQLTGGGSGNIPRFRTNINNGTVSIVGEFTIWALVDQCPSDDKKFTIEIKPTPDINPVGDIFLCHEDIQPTISFTSSNFPMTATFEWSRSQVNIGNRIPLGTGSLPFSGSDFIPSFQTRNTSSGMFSEVSSHFSVQSKLSGCYSPPHTFVITIGAVPQLGYANFKDCAGPELSVADFSMFVDNSVSYDASDTEYHWKITDILPGWANYLDLPQINDPQTGSIGTFHPDTTRNVDAITGAWIHNSLWGEDQVRIEAEAYVTLKQSDVTGLGCSSEKEYVYITINPLPITQFNDANIDKCVSASNNTKLYRTVDGALGSTYEWGWRTDPSDPDYDLHHPRIPNQDDGITPVDSYKARYFEVYEYPTPVGVWAGWITVREQNSYGCRGPESNFYLKTVSAPVVELQPIPPYPACSGEPVQLNATVDGFTNEDDFPVDPVTGAKTIQIRWFPSVDSGKEDSLNPLFTRINNGMSPIPYTVTFQAQKEGCVSDLKTTLVQVYPLPRTPQLEYQNYCSDRPEWAMNITESSIQTGSQILWERIDGSNIYTILGTASDQKTVVMNSLTGGALTYTNALPDLPGNITNDVTFTYRVRQQNSLSGHECPSDPAEAQMTIRIAPEPPVPVLSEYCQDLLSGGRYPLEVIPPPNATLISWYRNPSLDATSWVGSLSQIVIQVAGASEVDTPESSGTPATYKPFNYYAVATALNQCTSTPATVPLTIFPALKLKIELSDLEGCSPFDLGATNTSPSEFAGYQWTWTPDIPPENAPLNVTKNHLYQTTGTIPEAVWLKLSGVSTHFKNSMTGEFCSNTKDTMVIIHPGVKADFSDVETEGCDPLTIFFNAGGSQGAHRYRWYWDREDLGAPNFTPGNPPVYETPDAENPSPRHTFENKNSPDKKEYHVWLQVDNGRCVAEKDVVITIYPTPNSAFSHNLTENNCPPLPVTFYNDSQGPANTDKTLYQWNFGEGELDPV